MSGRSPTGCWRQSSDARAIVVRPRVIMSSSDDTPASGAGRGAGAGANVAMNGHGGKRAGTQGAARRARKKARRASSRGERPSARVKYKPQTYIRPALVLPIQYDDVPIPSTSQFVSRLRNEVSQGSVLGAPPAGASSARKSPASSPRKPPSKPMGATFAVRGTVDGALRPRDTRWRCR